MSTQESFDDEWLNRLREEFQPISSPSGEGLIENSETSIEPPGMLPTDKSRGDGPTQSSQTSDTDLELGSLLGPYRVLQKLGQGGMGAVYEALHEHLNKIVALKVLPQEQMKRPDAIARFQREMQVVGGIDNPHLVRALDAGHAKGIYFLVMEYVDGMDLDVLVQKRGPLPFANACELIRQATVGLAAAHQCGAVHRDIKPANLMLARQDFGPPIVKVLDLGLALMTNWHADPLSDLTAPNQIMGTLDYMAPEQAVDSHAVDSRADIYSMGAALYRLLTARHPYHGPKHQTVLQKLHALANEPIPNIQILRPNLPKPFFKVLRKMLAKNREDRYKDLEEVADALLPFTTGADFQALFDELDSDRKDDSKSRATSTCPTASTDLEVAPPNRSGRSPRTLIMLSLVVLLSTIVFFFATPVYLFVSDQGQLIVETGGSELPIQILRDGKIVEPNTTDRELILPAGSGDVEVLRADGTKLTSMAFHLPRGRQTTVRFNPSDLEAPTHDNPRSVSPNQIHLPKSEFIQPQDGWVSLLSCVDVARDVPPKPEHGGPWRKLQDGLRSPIQEFARIRIPLAAQGGYKIRAEFSRLSGNDAVDFYLPVASRQVLLVIDGFNGLGLSGLQAVKKKNHPIPGETGVANFRLENGVKYTLEVTVTFQDSDATIQVRVGGRGSFSFEWTGPISDLSLIDAGFDLGDSRVFGLAAWESEVHFYQFTFRALTTNAQWTRPPWIEVTPPENR